FLPQHIGRLCPSQSLQSFLQGRLEIGHGQRAAFTIHALEFRRQNLAHDKFADRLHSSVEVNGCQDGFQSVPQKRRLASATALLFTSPQAEIVSELQLLRHLDQVPLTHEMSAQLREFPLPKLRKPLE